MLKVHSLSCRRGSRLVFRDVGFVLEPGAFLAVTGANGSGKSSLLRLLAGLLPKHDGDVLWQDSPIEDDWEGHAERLHYIGHLDAVKPELTVEEMRDYWQSLRGLPHKPIPDPFGTEHFKHKRIRFLSAGQKRRLALTRLMLDDAPLWLLDEPTTALDHHAQGTLAALITEHRKKGGMVLAAMHDRIDLPDTKIFTMPEARA